MTCATEKTNDQVRLSRIAWSNPTATVASICLRRSNPNPFYYTMKLAAATVLLSASSALAFAPSKVAFRPSSTTGLFATEVAAEPKVRVVGRLRIGIWWQCAIAAADKTSHSLCSLLMFLSLYSRNESLILLL
jgi:hypothetical protein